MTIKVEFIVSGNLNGMENTGITNIRGDIVNLSIEDAYYYIERSIVKPFSYSISENDILIKYVEFEGSDDFKRKVDIFCEVLLVTNRSCFFLMDDDSIVKFELIPVTSDEWYYYNTQIGKFYCSYLLECSFVIMKNEFNRKKPEDSRQLPKFVKSEIENIDNTIANDFPSGIAYWYNMQILHKIPSKGEEQIAFLSKELRYGIPIFWQGIALGKYKEFLYSFTSDIVEIKEKLNQKQIALKYRYLFMTSDEFHIKPIWREIALDNGYKSENSGHKINQLFNVLRTKQDRISYRNSKKDIKKVIESLCQYPEAKAIAEKELKDIKNI